MLVVNSFKIIRQIFFDYSGDPAEFSLRDRTSRQDDPLDEYIARSLRQFLPEGATCQRASGPLVSPDMVVHSGLDQPGAESRPRSESIFSIEVKKLGRDKSGRIARPTSIDFNTTPPCGTIRIYDAEGQPLDIPSYYLFVCQERKEDGKAQYLSALCMCHGDLLNSDFDLYLAIVGPREKRIGLGSYGDGANRDRPMLIFSNPLGCPALDKKPILVDARDDLAEAESLQAARPDDLISVGKISRSLKDSDEHAHFFCYRLARDTDPAFESFHLVDPFPTPRGRTTTTAGRGKFVLQS